MLTVIKCKNAIGQKTQRLRSIVRTFHTAFGLSPFIQIQIQIQKNIYCRKYRYRAIDRSIFDYGCIMYGTAPNTNLR